MLLCGCTAPLIDEPVLGHDVAVTWHEGAPGDLLGSSVAWEDGRLIASAPGPCEVEVVEEAAVGGAAERRAGPCSWVGWWEGQAVQAGAMEMSVDREPFKAPRGMVAWAAGESGLYVATGERLIRLDAPWSVAVRGVRSLAAGTGRVLAVVCEDHRCEGRAWTAEGADLGVIVEAGERGSIAEWEGVAWAGAPDWWTPGARGRVCSEEGSCFEGEEGDHLGRAIGGGYTAGMFNKYLAVPRLRVVPLAGGTVWAMEEGAEQELVTLAGDGDALVVGAPWVPVGGEPGGKIAVLVE